MEASEWLRAVSEAELQLEIFLLLCLLQPFRYDQHNGIFCIINLGRPHTSKMFSGNGHIVLL